MNLEEPLKQAGVNTNRARLVAAAEAALRSAKWQPELALGKLIAEVNADIRLLRGLHNISESASRELALALLSQLAADAQGPKREAASQRPFESQCAHDRRPPAPIDSSRASHLNSDSLKSSDRSTAPSTSSRVSQFLDGSNVTLDRPAADLSKGGPSHAEVESPSIHVRPSRSISTSAAKSVLRSSVFDKRIVETFDHRWGDITQHDFLNLRIKNAFSKEVERGLESVQWPDMTTPLRQFCTEQQVQNIAERADRARQQALTAVKAVAHA